MTNKLPNEYVFGDVYIDSQTQYRQWLVGGCLDYESPAFWSSRGATDEQAEDISQAWIQLVERILQNTMPTPIGQIITTITPLDDSNWLPMTGGNYLLTSYPELADVIPTHWIFGTQFSLPNMAQYFMVGAVPMGHPDETAYGIGRLGGEKDVLLGINHIPPHGHTAQSGGNFVVGRGSLAGAAALASGSTHIGQASTANAGGGQAHNNMPPSVAVYFYIRAR